MKRERIITIEQLIYIIVSILKTIFEKKTDLKLPPLWVMFRIFTYHTQALRPALLHIVI